MLIYTKFAIRLSSEHLNTLNVQTRNLKTYLNILIVQNKFLMMNN